MFYVKKIERPSSKKQVLIDGILVSEETEIKETYAYFKIDHGYIIDFSEKTLFESLSQVYNSCTKKIKFKEGTMEIEVLPDPDFSSLSKEDGMKEIYDCLNYIERYTNNESVEYVLIEE